MAALTNALQALGARAKQTVMRQPNAVKALHNAVRDAVEHQASELTKPGRQIDALLNAMSAVDAAALGIQEYKGACTYLGIVEHADYAIATFVLAPGARIPLHDHPGMTVLSKLLFGRLRVTSYDAPPPVPAEPRSAGLGAAWSRALRRAPSRRRLSARPPEVRTVAGGPASEVLRLEPLRGNLHCFEALEHTAIFDVLTPPYNHGADRPCRYYEVGERGAADSGEVELLEVGWPDSLSIVNLPYSGVRLRL